MTAYAKVIGTGGYLPAEIKTNEDISRTVDTSDSWIFERTGIKSRRIAAKEETASSMAEIAARQAIDMADIEPKDIDLIIVATGTPDNIYPSTGCMLQHRLGIKECVAFDIQAACSGSIFGLDMANQYIKSGAAKTVLVVGTEICSRIVDWTDRGTCILFGDGAGAVLLQAADEAGILSTHIHSDGRFEDLLNCPNPQALGKAETTAYISMKGNEVFKVAVNTLGRIVDETLTANNMQKEDIDWLVPHQANSRIIAATAKKLKMSMDRVVLTLENQGNTSSASVLLAFNEAVRDGRIQRGHVVLLEAFGAGFTWGSALIKF
ncbi:3-oxoacyl-[acyl-carrier-protein] synthase III [Bathymodiolus platifrons methanotrophic gill symbiont]|uniref:beta-ketoacyl-ACP synthase III n=1 Tax=Bathymodiolus platifrons methanotrophic gill symbiont TaxID=113268 RepID=UPI000B40B9A3|nr:beta-ketoacyl-ACP synthase III [Bathymodiolus platifrons methanotrophic gill symbiont]TXL15874.1 3-oxoacyl-ACP synthase [Methylococcaceae bacterium HT4]TXL20858.1 3-oxoacyl-ACP synthase [Methylococcaceae bacterium HT5]GAW85596.1 3-oxoacyl-[acyl-carrier-protein] synthase III [Bathymodiolus platifrons methanotrophic gill symbiont]GFO77295.1 3-oxoacyl-[acyl-carrier-protein] synthase III [Bathymodiolus platifrons methanotrophic gill symbiont]